MAAFAVKGKMSGEIRKKMLSQVGHYDEAGYEAVTKAWDAVQERLECCGVEDWTDWLNSTSVPDSCCLGNQAGCGLQATEDTVHTRGCFSAFKQKFVDNLDNVGSKLCKLVNYCIMSSLLTLLSLVMVLCVAVMELIIIVLACCLGNRMKTSRKNKDNEAPPPKPSAIQAGTLEEIEKLTSKIVSLSKEKAETEISEAKAQAEIVSLKSEISKISSPSSEQVGSLKKELEGAAGQIKQLTEQLEKMKSLKKELETSQESAEREKKAKAEVEVMIAKERSVVGDLTKQLEDLKKANKSGEDEARSLKAELDKMKTLKRDLESARKEVEKEKKSKSEIEVKISRERTAVVELTKQLEDLKEANRKAEDEMRSLKEELETMQDQESENGRDDSSSSKEELDSPEMSEAGEKKKWLKKPKKNKKHVF